MQIEDLISDFLTWSTNTVVQTRLANAENGYGWLYKDINYTDDLSVENYQKFFDRTSQNEEYVKNYNVQDNSSKQPYAWLQNEINMIYSFHKCFAMRNATRLQYYRNDLSQKGARTSSAINIAIGKYLHKKEQAEQNN